MPSIIPKTYYCPKCKKEVSKKVCDCGSKTKPQPPYSVRFRWVDETGITKNMRIVDESGKGWQTQSAAQRGYEDWIAAHPTHEKPKTRTFEFMPLYAEYKAHLRANIKESSYLAFIQRMDKYVVPTFKNKCVNEISAVDVVKWQNELSAKNLSYKYKKCIRSALNHFFSYLKIYGIQNPLTLVKGFKSNTEAKKEMDFWTQAEFEQFISVVDDLRYKAVFSFLYLTGCRKGEALALRWNDIDLANHTANIRATLTKTMDKERDINEGEIISDIYRITTPKTENSYRKILLPITLISYLKDLKAKYNAKFVFGKDDNIMSFNTLEHAFKRYIGISGVKNIRIHDLRHSHASLLINKGDNQLSTIYIIAARLGDSVEMILKTYGHMFPNAEKDVIEKLNFNY